MAETAKHELTQEAATRYIRGHGTHCPFCGSEHIEGLGFECDLFPAQTVTCTACGGEWREYYTIYSVAIIDRDDHYTDELVDPVALAAEDLHAACKALYDGAMEPSLEGKPDGFAQSTTAIQARAALAKAQGGES